MALLWLMIRVRWRRALAPSLAVCLLIGVIGGFILASAASARRVGGAYQALIDEIGAPDLGVEPGCNPTSAGIGCDAPAEPTSGDLIVERLNDIAVVDEARVVATVIPYLVNVNGEPLLGTADDSHGCYDGDRTVHMTAVGSGGASDQAMPFRLDGEMPTTGSAGVVVARATAERADLVTGGVVRLAGWCTGEGDPVQFDTPIELRVTGLSIGPLDVEPPGVGLALELAYVDPNVLQALISIGAEPAPNVVVWLDPAATPADVGEGLASFDIVIDFRERAELFDRALATDARLLWLLAGIGAVGGLLVLVPVIDRNLRDTGSDTATLAALGAQRPQIAKQAFAHAAALGLIGALLAAALAVPFSALMPRGLAAAMAPHRQLWFDPVITVAGVGLVISVVLVIGAVPAWRSARARRSAMVAVSGRGGRIVGALGLRPAARTGVVAALGAPAGPRRASPWPTLVSMMVVGATGVASLTYLAGLRHLEQTPSLLGWNWDALVSFDFRPDSEQQAASTFAEIAEVDGVEQVTAGTSYPPWTLAIAESGIFVWPWSFATGPDAITPSIVTGRAPDGPDEVAIDAVFADLSGLGVGDVVSLSRPTLRLRIAGMLQEAAVDPEAGGVDPANPNDDVVVASFEITGIAVLPGERSQEIAQATFTLDGYAGLVEPGPDEIAAARAALPDDLAPELLANVEDLLSNLDIEERSVYLRFSGDIQSAATAVAAVDGVPEVVAPTADQVLTLLVGLNLTRNDRVPVALVSTVAAAFAALAIYLLVAAVRARRFELAVLRALGMSTSGICRSIAAQATAIAFVTLMVAIPVGVVVGRLAWLAYARDLHVVPVAMTPWFTLAVIAVATIAVANLAAVVPGWGAAKRSPGRDLRSE